MGQSELQVLFYHWIQVVTRVAFNVPDMTHLRYYVPLSNAITRAMPEVQQEFLVTGDKLKYNSVGLQVNRKRYTEIVAGMNVKTCTDPSGVYDAFFTVEGYNSFHVDATKTYAIQHGFDYRASAKGCASDTIHIMSADDYARDLVKLVPSAKTVVSPGPIAMWEIELFRSHAMHVMGPGPHAVIFYPENGCHELVGNVIKALELRGYVVSIKQRTKNQRVPHTLSNRIYYDCDWYPSESIYFPLAAEVCIGFGTSAYTDLIPVGVSFIDVTIPEYSRMYLKPTSPYFRVIEHSSTAEQIVAAAVLCSKESQTLDKNAIDVFVRGLIQ